MISYLCLSIKHTIREFNDKEFDLTIASKIDLEFNESRNGNFIIFLSKKFKFAIFEPIYICVYMIIVLRFFIKRYCLQFILIFFFFIFYI